MLGSVEMFCPLKGCGDGSASICVVIRSLLIATKNGGQMELLKGQHI